MASVDSKTKTTHYATTDWDQYRQGRPPYPASLTDIIYSYRRRHPKVEWERLVDIGAGSGIASTNFMPDFKVAHISDPSPWNVEQARVFLSNWVQHHGLSTRLEYTQSTGEEAYAQIGEKQADLVICGTAAHFMDPDGLVASIAKILRPGGTLAVFGYSMPTFPDRSQRFHDAFANLLDSVFVKPFQSVDCSTRASHAKAVERQIAGKGGLDFLPLPEDLYEDPLRVYINFNTDEIPYKALWLKLAPANPKPGGISRVTPEDETVSYKSGIDPAAEGWSFDADKKWLSAYCDTVRPLDNKLSEEESGKADADWEQVFDDECPTGTVRVLWPAYAVLATRK